MREVSKIRFIFNDLEMSDWVGSECLKNFCIKGIRKEIRETGVNSICEVTMAKHIEMELYSEADHCSGSINAIYRGSLFKRIMLRKDILSFEIAYDDGTFDTVYVLWGGEDQTVNGYQESSMDERGGAEVLKLVVSGKKYVSTAGYTTEKYRI